jgi:hypothetical protein
MFLMIFEDGEVKSTVAVGDDDIQSSDDGYLDLIDITDPEAPKRRWSCEWVDIESID